LVKVESSALTETQNHEHRLGDKSMVRAAGVCQGDRVEIRRVPGSEKTARAAGS